MNKKKTVIILSVFVISIVLVLISLQMIQRYGEKKKIEEIHVLFENLNVGVVNLEAATSYNPEEFNDFISFDREIDFSLHSLELDGKKIETTINFVKPGSHELRINFSNINSPKEVFTKVVSLMVKDTEGPVISGYQNYETNLGVNVDYKNGVTASDEVDGEVDVKFEGEVNFMKAGIYNVEVIAVDNSNNISKANIEIKVLEKKVIETIPSKEVKHEDKTNNTISIPNSNNHEQQEKGQANNGTIIAEPYKPNHDPKYIEEVIKGWAELGYKYYKTYKNVEACISESNKVLEEKMEEGWYSTFCDIDGVMIYLQD